MPNTNRATHDACASAGGFRQSGRRPGGEPSITPPQTLQRGGEDWLEVSLYLQWQPEQFQAIAAMLDEAKEAAAHTEQDKMGAHAEADLGAAGVWLVHPNARRMGGETGPMARWRLERDGIAVALMNRAAPHETMPSASVRLTGDVLLLQGGADALWQQVRGWFEAMGATITREIIGRVDVAVDLPGVDVREFYQAFAERRIITRAKKAKEFGEGLYQVHRTGLNVTGITIGRAPMLRIYDKLAECTDPTIREALRVQRWGGEIPTTATRVEFQLRGEFLKRGGWVEIEPGKRKRLRAVESFADWQNARALIVEYLTSKWVRFVDSIVDRRHTERATSTPLWSRIGAALRAMWDRASEFVPRLDRDKINPEALLNQIRGCFERVAAIKHRTIEAADDFLGSAVDWLAEHIANDHDIPERVRLKRALAA